MKYQVLTIASILALATPASAADTYTLDPAHTNIVWTANHIGFSDVTGFFKDVEGSFVLDEDNPENSSVEVSLKPENILTVSEQFSTHLKSADFFNIEKFATVTFKSTKVEKTGDNTATITGDLTMLGQTHPLVLAATMNKIDENPFTKNKTAGFTLTGKIDREMYAMGYGIPAIGKDVNLTINVEGIKQ